VTCILRMPVREVRVLMQWRLSVGGLSPVRKLFESSKPCLENRLERALLTCSSSIASGNSSKRAENIFSGVLMRTARCGRTCRCPVFYTLRLDD
jgi:hypothetical protein